VGGKGEAGGGPGAQINFEGRTLWHEKQWRRLALFVSFRGGRLWGVWLGLGRAGLFASFCEVTRRKRERERLCLWFSIPGKLNADSKKAA
jgi:hypothetical protein